MALAALLIAIVSAGFTGYVALLEKGRRRDEKADRLEAEYEKQKARLIVTHETEGSLSGWKIENRGPADAGPVTLTLLHAHNGVPLVDLISGKEADRPSVSTDHIATGTFAYFRDRHPLKYQAFPVDYVVHWKDDRGGEQSQHGTVPTR